MGYIDQVNETIVSPDLLEEVLAMHSALPQEERQSFESRAFHLTRFLVEKGIDEDRGDLVVAIPFRLEALAHLIAENPMMDWIVSSI